MHEACSAPSHIFTNLDDLVAPGIRAELDQAMQCPSASLQQKQNAYDRMRDILARDEKATFPVGHMVKCAVHTGSGKNSGCPVGFLVGDKGGVFRLWVAGTTCVHFSSRGNREGTAGESMRPFRVWAAAARVAMPDVIVHEITPSLQAAEMMHDAFNDLFVVHTALVNPCDLGYPMDRLRQISICVARSRAEFKSSWAEFSPSLGGVSFLLARFCSSARHGMIVK